MGSDPGHVAKNSEKNRQDVSLRREVRGSYTPSRSRYDGYPAFPLTEIAAASPVAFKAGVYDSRSMMGSMRCEGCALS